MSSNRYLIKLNFISLKSSNLFSNKLIKILLILFILINIKPIESRKHHLVLNNDDRKYFTVSTFGFFTGGTLTVEVNKFSFSPFNGDSVFGLTLAKTMSDSLTPYLDEREDKCLLMDKVKNNDQNIGLISMKFDFNNNLVLLKCNEILSKLRLFDVIGSRPKRSDKLTEMQLTSNSSEKETKLLDEMSPKVNKNDINVKINKESEEQKSDDSKKVNKIDIKKKINNDIKDTQNVKQEKQMSDNKIVNPLSESVSKNDDNSEVLTKQTKSDENAVKQKSCAIDSVKLSRSGDPNKPEFSFKIQAVIVDDIHEGLYTLFFHNCPNYGFHRGFRAPTSINLSMFITEQNLENYLSAGEIPLPQLYFALSVIFFLIGVIWVHVIRNKTGDAFKIHYLMAALVFVKAFSLLFHGINYHFIAKEGSQVETWAVLYYITHLLKGALLFITIVLIGTGWAFIKHILSDKDKKIFMIVIPLQVLANIADIITEESEEGELKHNMWREIFVLVDLLCCGAILFPIVWSIRHLQEASQTDGKAAINLRKLKLFRHFYVMIVCYIYFTRIIVILLKITVPFQYEWLNVFFQHTATLLFFILTGYYFQPTSTNPYFQLTQSDDDLEMEEVLFVQPNIGFSETKKRNRDIEANADTERLITKRESSHDFD